MFVSMRKLEYVLGTNRKELFELSYKCGSYYQPFDTKRCGSRKWRHIDNPTGRLKKLQKRINDKLLGAVDMPPYVHGAVKRRSIITNARNHVGRRVVFSIDLKDCYPNITNQDVYAVLRAELGCSSKVASLITRLTTFGRRLPQGAPTSASLANIVLLPLYRDLVRIAESRGLTATFYVDDLTFSGDHLDEQTIPELVAAIHRHGHKVRGNKVKVMWSSGLQSVTGLTVNRKVSVPRRTRSAVREWVMQQRHVERRDPPELQSMRGKLAWVTAVDNTQAAALRRFINPRVDLTLDGQVQGRARRTERRACRGMGRHRHPIKQPQTLAIARDSTGE